MEKKMSDGDDRIKQIPYGISDYELIRKENYAIDKKFDLVLIFSGHELIYMGELS